MRCLIIIVCLVVSISKSFSDRVVIHTASQFGTLYQFFPLRTNVLFFSVKASNDVHICLTNTPMLQPPYYEIAIGGWSNTKSVLRKDSQEPVMEHNGTIVNQDKFQTFYVTIDDKEGSISVGKRPDDSFMYYKDPDFVKTSYFGISTGFGSKGEWNFDFSMFNCENGNTNYHNYNNYPAVSMA